MSRKTVIVCAGAQVGRALVYGEVDKVPCPGEAVTIYNARMILYFDGTGGIFKVSVSGPVGNSRITCAVEQTACRCQEVLLVTDQAKSVFDSWPAAE